MCRLLSGDTGYGPLPAGTESLLCLSQTLCTQATMQTVRAADTNEVVKLIFRESDNDRKVREPSTPGGPWSWALWTAREALSPLCPHWRPPLLSR